jgi:dihydropteridine reductase
MASKSVLIYGGIGGLGQVLVKYFKEHEYHVISVDFRSSPLAQESYEIKTGAKEDVLAVVAGLKSKNMLVDAVICAAGGFAMEFIDQDNVFDNMERMYSFNIRSSVAAAHVASHTLKPGGLLAFFGASGALQATPAFLAYGISKAGVHHLVKTLADDNSHLPKNTTTLALLPITLDTPQNRKDMPNANFDNWTPLETVAQILYDWSEGKNRPASGSMIQLKTENKQTKLIPVEMKVVIGDN